MLNLPGELKHSQPISGDPIKTINSSQITSQTNLHTIETINIDDNNNRQTPAPKHEHHIRSLLLSMESINTTYINVSAEKVPIVVTQPWDHKIITVGDTGANMNAISLKQAQKYVKYIQSEPRAFRVRTGGGYISCQDYVSFTIKDGETYLRNIKFYIIPDLPFQYLTGLPLLRQLGWHLANLPDLLKLVYHHKPEDLDCIDEDDDVFNNYPLSPETETPTPISQPKISDRDKDLTEYIINRLKLYQHVCAQNEFDIGQIPNSEFKIEFKDNVDTTPIRCNEYPHDIRHVYEIERQLRHLLKIGFISRSNSPWRSPTFVVPKKNGEARIVFDYRLLNAITKRMAYSLPSIEQLTARFKGKYFISTIDIKSGYWHIPVRKEDRQKTAFIFNGKVYEWNVMPFGPTNAPPHFQKVMDEIFSDLQFVMVYMDDITIISRTAEEHKSHLEEVFKRLSEYKIKIRPDKCTFAQETVEYLGFIIDATGVKIKSKYKDKIHNIPIPKSLKQLQRFIGMVQYLHKFIPNLQTTLAPLHNLTRNKTKFEWNADLNALFHKIKLIIMETKMIYHPDPSKPFVVYCDASQKGIGAVLAQVHDGKLRPIQFSSKLFNTTQQNWHVSEQEIYAVIHAVEKWRQYLIGQQFTVYTDHMNLQELFNRAKNFKAGKLYRWAVRLQEFDFKAKYIQGKKNIMADYLSRDALQPSLPEVDIKQPNTHNICELYIQHLCTCSTNATIINESSEIKEYIQLHHHIDLYNNDDNVSGYPHMTKYIVDDSFNNTNHTINPTFRDEVDSGSDDDSDDSSNNNDKLQPRQAPITPTIKVQHEPIPLHKYNTRYAKQQRGNKEFQDNLKQPLHLIPDPSAKTSFDDETSKTFSKKAPLTLIEQTNQTIINNKYDIPKHNPSIFEPENDIHDNYDIDDFVNNYNTTIIQKKQTLDPYLFPIIEYLTNHNKYLLKDLPIDRYRLVLSGRYYINHQNLLMYKYGDVNAIVIPASLTRSVLQWAHHQVHHGGTKMFLIITTQAKYWWPGMRNDIKQYLKTCKGCQSLQKGPNYSNKSGKIKTFSTTTPFELVSIDLCGPLPQTSKDNRYILSMIDKFSRFCMLVPLPDVKTLSVVKGYRKWINLFGAPNNLLSDNGSQFTAEIFKTFNELYDVKQKFSTPYYPESNGQIERLHRWIKERLSLLAIDGGLNFIDGDDDWDDYIGIIQHSYNSTPNTMTKYSPNKIIFGQDLKTNIKGERITIESKSQSTQDFIRYINNTKSIIQNKANLNQNRYDEVRSKSYNKKRYEAHQYEIGDLILIDWSRRLSGNASKLKPTWQGPYEIIEIIVPTKTYKVREVGNEDNIQQVNIRMMKIYKSSPYLNIINYMHFEHHKLNQRKIIHYINQRRLSF